MISGSDKGKNDWVGHLVKKILEGPRERILKKTDVVQIDTTQDHVYTKILRDFSNHIPSNIKLVKAGEKLDSNTLQSAGYDYLLKITHAQKYEQISFNLCSSANPNETNYAVDLTMTTFGHDYPQTKVVCRTYLEKQMPEPKPCPVLAKKVLTPIAFASIMVVSLQQLGTAATASAAGASSAASISILGVNTSYSTIGIVGVMIAAVMGGGILIPGYVDSASALTYLEISVIAGNDAFESRDYDNAFDSFREAQKIYEKAELYPDHVDYAEELYMLSLAGQGNTLRLQAVEEGHATNNIDKAKIDQAEQIFKYAIELNSDKYDIENIWIARGLNSIYYEPELSIQYCGQSKSIDGHLCVAEAKIILYKQGKISKNSINDHFDLALKLANYDTEKSDIMERKQKLQESYRLLIE